MKSSLPNWKDKTIFEKVLFILSVIVAIIVLIMAFWDVTEKYKLIKYYEPIYGLWLFIEGLIYFKYNRKLSILFFLCTLLITIMFVCMLIMT